MSPAAGGDRRARCDRVRTPRCASAIFYESACHRRCCCSATVVVDGASVMTRRWWPALRRFTARTCRIEAESGTPKVQHLNQSEPDQRKPLHAEVFDRTASSKQCGVKERRGTRVRGKVFGKSTHPGTPAALFNNHKLNAREHPSSKSVSATINGSSVNASNSLPAPGLRDGKDIRCACRSRRPPPASGMLLIECTIRGENHTTINVERGHQPREPVTSWRDQEKRPPLRVAVDFR